MIRIQLNTVAMSLADLKEEQTTKDPENETGMQQLGDMQEACDASVTILDELLLYEQMESNSLILRKKHLRCFNFLKSVVLSFELQVLDNIIITLIEYFRKNL